VVIATAVIPTIIAQTWFRPTHAEVADFADEALAVKEGE